MDIRHLKHFIAVAEYGSFSKAAEHLYTIQPNVSRSIKQLEEELQVELFVRGGKVTSLTANGEMVLNEARDIVRKADQLKEKLCEHNQGEHGRVRFGYQSDIDPEDIAKITGPFGSKYPNVEVVFTKRSVESDLISAVYEGELDVAVTSATVGLDLESLRCVEIAANELVLVVPAQHRFQDLGMVRKEDLVGESIILFPRYLAPIYYDWIFKSLLGRNKNTIIHEPDMKNILLKVASGQGISIQSTVYLKSTTAKVRIVKLEYDRQEINANLILFWKSQNPNPSLRLLVQECHGRLSDDQGDGSRDTF